MNIFGDRKEVRKLPDHPSYNSKRVGPQVSLPFFILLLFFILRFSTFSIHACHVQVMYSIKMRMWFKCSIYELRTFKDWHSLCWHSWFYELRSHRRNSMNRVKINVYPETLKFQKNNKLTQNHSYTWTVRTVMIKTEYLLLWQRCEARDGRRVLGTLKREDTTVLTYKRFPES